jgi:hypothetical protein
MRSIPEVLVVAVIAGVLSSCGGAAPSAAPSALRAATPQNRAEPAGSSVAVDPVPEGFVADTAFRAIADVRVEVVDGPQAGTSLVSDASGVVPLIGPFVSDNTFRASKEGYITATQGFNVSTPGGRPWLAFYLKPVAAPANIAGDYTLTMTADSACTELPAALQARSFPARIAPATGPATASGTSFELTVIGTPVLGRLTGFEIGVAGDTLGFWLHGGHDPVLVEQLTGNTYLAYSGWGTATISGSEPATISAPFEGWIEYCAMPAPMVAVYNCGTSNSTGDPIPGAALARTHCESRNHQLVLTRR